MLPLNSKLSPSVFWIIVVVSSLVFQLWPFYPSSLFFTQHLKRFCSSICQIKSPHFSKLSNGIPPLFDSKPKSLQRPTGPYRIYHPLTLQYPLNPFPVALPFPQLSLMGLHSICLKSSRQRELVLFFFLSLLAMPSSMQKVSPSGIEPCAPCRGSEES